MTARRARIRLASLSCLLAVSAAVWSGTSVAGQGAAARRPDAWLKYCGNRNDCVLDPWHPWRGKDVYNTTGANQTVSSGLEQGVMIRFFVMVQNDGTQAETIKVDGCSGNSTFTLVSVNVGAWRAGTEQNLVTSKFKAGTLSFAFPAASTEEDVILTVRFKAGPSATGVSYSCPIVVSTTSTPAVKDKVIAKITTI